MKTSEIFEACIPLIQSGDLGFICHAICKVKRGAFEQRRLWREFVQSNDHHHKIIMERLMDKETLLGTCLEIRNGFLSILQQPEEPEFCFLGSEMKEFRVLWLKSLVEEFKAKGD